MRNSRGFSAIDHRLGKPAGPEVVIARNLCGNRRRNSASRMLLQVRNG
jgi:hypothetical protein